MANKKKYDWEAIEREYRAGQLSLREIGRRYGCSDTAIRKKAKKLGWERDEVTIQRQVAVLDKDQYNRAGFVYVIYLDDSAGERFYKIGMAAAFTPRFQTHQCASPFDICVACAYYVPDMRSEERLLHHLFSEKRVKGEWFRLTSEDLDKISARARLV